MLQRSVLICITLLLITVPVLAAGPALTIGQATLSGATLSFPMTLTNVTGTSISGLSTDIGFNPDVFAVLKDTAGTHPVISAIAGAAATAAGKSIVQSSPAYGVLRIVILDIGGNSPIANGVVAQVSFTVATGASPSKDLFKNTPSATDPSGNAVSISGSSSYATVVPTGNLKGYGNVDLTDAMRALQIAIGLTPATAADLVMGDVAPLVNGKPAPNGVIDIADAYLILEKVVNLVSW